jgi:hypothetical protein
VQRRVTKFLCGYNDASYKDRLVRWNLHPCPTERNILISATFDNVLCRITVCARRKIGTLSMKSSQNGLVGQKHFVAVSSTGCVQYGIRCLRRSELILVSAPSRVV